MRLTSDPKPIKIRIVSGDEEHSSLDSLLHCFCLPDLQKVDKQLLHWLMRQGEHGLKIVDELSKVPNWANATTVADCFRIYSAFFPKIKENKFGSLLELLEFWYGKSEFKKNTDYLIRLSFRKDDDITLFCYNHKIEGLTNDWFEVLKDIPSAKQIVEAVLKEEEKEFQKRVLANRKRFYPRAEYERWMRDITSYWNYDSEFNLFGKDKEGMQRNAELKYFIIKCKTLCDYKGNMPFYSVQSHLLPQVHDADFLSIRQFYEYMEKDFLFCAKVFVLLLFEIKENWNHIQLWRKELVSCYTPAAYMVADSNCPSLKASDFKFLGLKRQIEFFVCYHLFEF